jgi:hypothetical protein
MNSNDLWQSIIDKAIAEVADKGFEEVDAKTITVAADGFLNHAITSKLEQLRCEIRKSWRGPIIWLSLVLLANLVWAIVSRLVGM